MKLSPEEGAWNFKGREELEKFLEESDIRKSDICLVGSISLSVRGLREHGDLDICIHSDKRDQINTESLDGFVTLVEERYNNIELSDDELISDDTYHDVIDGFKVVRPEICFSYKKLRDLPKDERDVELLENYSQSTDDWDWSLYRSDYSQRPNSLLSRGVQSLQSDGVVVTVDKILGLASRKFPLIQKLNRYLPIYDIRTPYETIQRRTRELTTAELLNRQYASGQFIGYETVAYWAVAQADRSGSEPRFDTSKLGLDLDALRSSSISESESIKLSQRHHILEPISTTACLNGGCETVDVSFIFDKVETKDKQWLQECGLAQEEINHLENKRIDLLEEHGALFYAIFWPPTHEKFEAMEETLGEKVSIVRSYDAEISDIPEFVHAIYDAQTDTAPDWAIDWKAETMSEFPNIIRVIEIELPNPRLRNGISTEMEMVKNDLRHAFMQDFPDEYYLSIVHATDSFTDNLKTRDVIQAYSTATR